MAVALDPLVAIQTELQATAADPSLDPLERGIKLRDMRSRIVDLLGSCDELLGRVSRVAESEASEQARHLLWARGNADLREALLASGELSEVDLDAAGYLSHVEIDRLEEEGLLEATLAGFTPKRTWVESKYRRSHGKFADKPGSGVPLAGRGGAKVDERYRDYFKDDPEASVVHISRLKPTRKDTPEHIAKARANLNAAKAGQMMKRKPLDVAENGDGTLSIIDGNSTHAALQEEGLTHLPVKINRDVGPGEAEHAARERVATELLDKATKAEPAVTAAMKRVTHDHGGQLTGLDYRLKGHESLVRKLEAKQAKYPNMAPNEVGLRISDPLRYKAIFPPDGYSEGVEATIAALRASGYTPWQIKNHWGGADDYDGLHVNMTGSDGLNIELQFHTPQSVDVEEHNHPLYEKFRVSKDPAERWALWQEMSKAAASIKQPRDVEKIGTLSVHPAPQRVGNVAQPFPRPANSPSPTPPAAGSDVATSPPTPGAPATPPPSAPANKVHSPDAQGSGAGVPGAGRGRPDVRFSETTDYDSFNAALGENTRAWNLTKHTAEELADSRVFLSDDGKSGFVISHDGDLQNVFRNPGGVKGSGRQAVEQAIQQGATTLDAYDGFLPSLYGDLGFVETGRMRFDPKYAPEGMPEGATPDVIFMAHGATPQPKPVYYDDWDKGKAASQQAVGKT